MGSGGKARVQQRSSGQPHPRQAEEPENAVPYQEEWEAVAVFRVEHVALSNPRAFDPGVHAEGGDRGINQD